MSNVVALNNAMNRNASTIAAANAQSPLMFTAYERPLWYEGKHGNKYDGTGHKALIRFDEERNKPVCLNVVRDTYRVVQNAELLEAVEAGFHHVLGSDATSVQVKDAMAYNGKSCYRQYIFNDINIESPEKDTIAFRVIVQNGFGGSAIKLHAGAIDFFCMNGMVLGDYTSEYAKHTSGVQIKRFTDTVRMAVDVFWKNKNTWNELRQTVLPSENTVVEWLKENFGERLGMKLYRHYLLETKTRGGHNMWALYSALIYYSTYATGEFTMRNTVNDHAADTMMKRENSVRNVMQNGAFDELRRAA